MDLQSQYFEKMTRKKKGQSLSKEEIIAKLKWFHGEEFEKYPLVDDLNNYLKRSA